jgi:ATP-dependent helicase/DNAse subunit B
VETAAALYLPIHRPGTLHKEPAPSEILETQVSDENKPHKATGLIEGSWCKSLDGTVGPKDRSRYYSFYMNKEGSVYSSTNKSVVKPNEMSKLLRHCHETVADLAGAIIGGKITVGPFRLGERVSPCSRCEFGSFCRFDFSCDPYRELPLYSKEEVLDRLSAATATGN